jgi:hypothetical protein
MIYASSYRRRPLVPDLKWGKLYRRGKRKGIRRERERKGGRSDEESENQGNSDLEEVEYCLSFTVFLWSL